MEVAQIVRPETILGWHRKLVAMKFDGSKGRSSVGRAPTAQAIEEMVLKFARENRRWGYRRIVGALSNVGYEINRQTVGNVLERQGNAILFPAPEDRIGERAGDIQTRERLGGLLTFYYRDDA